MLRAVILSFLRPALLLMFVVQSEAQEAPPPITDVVRPQMTFRLIEGNGVFGLTRWIEAAGRISVETPRRFEEFRDSHAIEGLTVFLDSWGGDVRSGLALGRAFRAARLFTSVGRTVSQGEGDTSSNALYVNGVSCSSACAYAFLGGLDRRLPLGARLGVHQFTPPIGPDGRPFMAKFNAGFVSGEAQILATRLAVYLEDMGVRARLLELASSTAVTGIYYLTPTDLARTNAGTLATVAEVVRPEIPWSIATEAEDPVIYRLRQAVVTETRRIDEEDRWYCGTDEKTVGIIVQRILARAEYAQDTILLPTIRVSVGPHAVVREPRDATIHGTGRDSSVFTAALAVPIDLVRAGTAAGHLDLEVGRGVNLEPPVNLLTPAFAPLFDRLVETCTSRERVNEAAGLARPPADTPSPGPAMVTTPFGGRSTGPAKSHGTQ